MDLVLWNVFANNLCRSNTKKISWLTRDCTFDHHNTEIIVDFYNLKLPNLGFGSSHPTRHFLPFINMAWGCSSTNGSKGSMAFGSMSHGASSEVMPFNTTLEPLSDGYPGNIDEITLLEQLLKDQFLIGLKPIHRHQPKLLQMPHRNRTGLLQMPHLWLRQLPVPHPPVPHLHRTVAVGGLGLHLRHDVAFSEPHYGDRHHLSLRLEVAHHAELGGHDAHASLHAHSNDGEGGFGRAEWLEAQLEMGLQRV